MRILLLTQYYWPENFIINSVVKLLVIRGVKVTVLTGKPNYPDGKIFDGYKSLGLQRELQEGVTILRFPIVARGNHSRIQLALNYISFIFSGFFFGRSLVKDHGFDLVFVYAPSPLLQALPAIFLAHLHKVPLVVWVQDLWPESLNATNTIRNKWLLGLVASLVRLIYRASNRILVQSQAFIEPVSSLTNNPVKIHYYPNLYITSTKCQPSHRAFELVKELQSHFSVVFAGNLGTAQGLETIIETAFILLPYPDVRIFLVGSGSMDKWLIQMRETYGLTNLFLTGRLEASDMNVIFDAAEALLVSLSPEAIFDLTVPSKVQAYLFAGRPILASMNGEGASIILNSGAGFCSEAGDAEALSVNVLRLVALSPFQRNQMGQKGRRYFEKHFAPDVLADKLLEHFKEVIAEREEAI